MPPSISLALALHNHQPIGNFGWVVADVFGAAYEPMIAALERHPTVRLALHYSGPLLEWLVAERPDAIERLRALVERDQVEMLGGGLYEPVLVSLPERDRLGQLERMADEVERRFGRRPQGAWLAERVWEPDLPTSLASTGHGWTVLDDAHFRAAAIPEEALWGPYTTEDQGHVLRVFGTEQGLRYRIPFREVEEVIDYLHGHATEDGMRIGTMGDDGEKFGAWPTTWEHCWGSKAWVEHFLAALEANADWLHTTTPSAWLADHPPIGRAYIPSGSYAEMGEWALPADESVAFTDALHRAQRDRRPEARWLHGASWRNFQVKYREVNDLHKQMLRVSGKVEALAPGPARARALDHLYRAQSNDCYWHGLFGGIYLSHLRLATYEHLIAAEDLADAAGGTLVAADLADLDMDGLDEVRLAGPGQVVTVDLAEGAGIGAWDIRAVRHALAAVLRRRPEAYHDVLRSEEAAPSGDAGAEGVATGAAASIHEAVRAREPGLAARLVYDGFERRSGLVRALAPDTTPGAWADAAATELGDAVDRPFDQVALAEGELVARRLASIAGASIAVTKTIALDGDRRAPRLAVHLELEHLGGPALHARVGLEWTLTMLGGGGNPAAWWEVRGKRVAHDSAGSVTGVTEACQGNDWVGIGLATTVDVPADLWWAPVETISNSEGGFERVYQGGGSLFSWPVRLDRGDRWERTIEQRVTTAHDRTAEGL